MNLIDECKTNQQLIKRYSISMLTEKLQVPGLFDVTVQVLNIT